MKDTIVLFVFSLFVFSCGQRIKLDEGQWGTHADITGGIFLFQWKLEDAILAEGKVQGAKVESVTEDSAVDVKKQEVTTTVKAGTDLSRVACYIYYDGERVEPLDGAPVPGKISDFSAKNFEYRIYSADGKHKDWSFKIVP